ncbi:MAG: NusG domain II-containing protein [bacterium]|nr:NusG domain II-containing protein [bacterium]
MNKNDIILILTVSLITILLFVIPTRNSNYAYVYYDGTKIKEISLDKDDKYIVQGYNGNIVIEVKNKKIRVVEENSNNHLCSKQGFTNSIPIVCLPNKIVIDFSNDNNLDTVM